MIETCAELNVKIANLQWENQILKEARRGIHNDPCNQEMEENEVEEEVNRREVEQPRQRTPMVRLVEIPRLVKEATWSENHSIRNNELKTEDLED